MTNTINEDTVALVKEFEGLRLDAYPDPASGNEPWTIGYGHTGRLTVPTVSKGMVITNDLADQYLRNDLNAAAAKVASLVKVPLNDNQFGALVSFYFNVGETTFTKSSVLSYTNAGKFDSVPGRLALYRLGSGKVMPGLVRRRAAEGSLWLKSTSVAVPDHVVDGSSKPATPDRNDKKPWDWGAVGAVTTLAASTSESAKVAIGNVTTAVGIQPWQLLLVAGVGFAIWTIYNKFKKET